MNDKLIKQFVNYNIALELKSIGFDEPCLAYYNKKELFSFTQICNEPLKGHYIKMSNRLCTPTFSQVIDWFEENHNIYIGKTGYDDGKSPKRWVYHVDSYYIPEQTLESAIMYAINKIKNK